LLSKKSQDSNHIQNVQDGWQHITSKRFEDRHLLTGFARPSGSSSSADPMDVVFGDCRYVVIDDQLNFRNVKSSAGNVGGNQDLHLGTKYNKNVQCF
jgi:hypothetical protein